MTNYAYKKVTSKRKRKGIAEPVQRPNNIFSQFFVNSLSMCSAATIVAPLERARILAQTKSINRPEYSAKVSNTALGNIKYSIKDQGAMSLWRGNTALLYRNVVQMSLKLMLFDKFKHYFLPYDTSKYSFFQHYFRAACASMCSMSLTFFLTYPLEVIHTRGAADMSKNGRQRNYNGTFQTFNLTHIDEGRNGLYKGAGFAISQAMLKAFLTIPVYDTFKRMSPSKSETHLDRFMSRVGVAMIAGTLVSAVTYPLDTLKRIA